MGDGDQWTECRTDGRHNDETNTGGEEGVVGIALVSEHVVAFAPSVRLKPFLHLGVAATVLLESLCKSNPTTWN